jgi:hypothetical protein
MRKRPKYVGNYNRVATETGEKAGSIHIGKKTKNLLIIKQHEEFYGENFLKKLLT